ncbi:MAG: SAM-dependent methyltransferase, partial [Polyangia bacterium]
RRRFFASETGIKFHQEFMKTTEPPRVEYNRLEPGKIDDAVVFALLQRARAAGFHAWLMPQDPSLPMANRREDILVERP